MEERIQRIVAAAKQAGFEVPAETMTPTTEFSEVGLDSLGITQVALEVEKIEGIEIVDEDIETIRTLGDFADLVHRKIEAKK